MLGLCGVKLTAGKFNCIIIAGENQLIVKSMFGKPKCIPLTEIETITLGKKASMLKAKMNKFQFLSK